MRHDAASGYAGGHHRDHTHEQASGRLRRKVRMRTEMGPARSGVMVAQVTGLVDALLDILGDRVQAEDIRVRAEQIPLPPSPPRWRPPGRVWRRLTSPCVDRSVWRGEPAWIIAVIITVPDPRQAAFLAAALDLPRGASRASPGRQRVREADQVSGGRAPYGRELVWRGWLAGERPHVPLSITVTSTSRQASGPAPDPVIVPVIWGVDKD